MARIDSWPPLPDLRAVHQPDEGGLVPGDERGDTPHGVGAHVAVVLGVNAFQRVAGLDPLEHVVGVRSVRCQHVCHFVRVEKSSLVMA